MKDIKTSLSDILLGKIAEPSIEIEIDGNSVKFEGREAKVFSLGVLAGAKISTEGARLEKNVESK